MKIQDFATVPVDPPTSGAQPHPGYRGRQRLGHAHKAASVRTEPRQEYFKAGFTALSNAYLDDHDHALSPQESVFKWVLRHTAGYLKEWARFRPGTVQKDTKLKRSAFYRARQKLIELPLIEARLDEWGAPWVRLAPSIQPLKDEVIASLWSPFLSAPVETLEGAADAPCSVSWDGVSHETEQGVPRSGTPPIATEPNEINRFEPVFCAPKDNPLEESPTRQQHGPNVVVDRIAIANQTTDILPGCAGGDLAASSLAAPLLVANDEPEVLTAGEPSSPPAPGLEVCDLEVGPVAEMLAPGAQEVPPAPASNAENETTATDDSKAQKLQSQAERRAQKAAQAQKRRERSAPALQIKTQDRSPLSTEQLANAETLRTHGVADRIADRLARSHTTAQIVRALEALWEKREQVDNPGGYLNRALTEGWHDQEPESPVTPASEAEQVRQREERNTPPPLTSTEERELALETQRRRTAEAVAPGADRVSLELATAQAWFDALWDKASEEKRQQKRDLAQRLWRGKVAPSADQLWQAMIGHFMASERFVSEFARCYPVSN